MSDDAPFEGGMSVFVKFNCIQCDTKVYMVEAHARGFFMQCIRHTGMERVVMRHYGTGSKQETVHATVFILVEVGNRISAQFVACRVRIDMLQARIRLFLRRRRRARELRQLAFAMAGHPRLGAGNPIFAYLSYDAACLVLQAIR